MSDWQARVSENWQRFGVDIVWARDLGNGRREISNGDMVWVVDSGEPVANPDAQPLRLRDDMLRALHQTLLRYFDGADDARMLRKDYDAERARVDKLIDLATRRPW